MRRILLAVAATLAIVSAASLTTNRAEAMALGTPSGLRAAIEETSLAQDVAYVCRRVWVCGYYGCGWRRSCFWRPGGYYYRPYRRWRYY
jgi:hypothetical protein